MLYQSSKGPIEIDGMVLSYAKNALGKLTREAPERTSEIEALLAHVDKLSSDENPRAVIGGNNPPEEAPTPEVNGRKAVDTHVSDLLIEAKNWADGEPIANQGQADNVGKLHRQLQQAVTLVNDNATKEKKPHNDAIKVIAEWQNGYVAKDLKTVADGTLTKAIAATGKLSATWLKKLDDERKEREQIAADAAKKAAEEALAARAEAKESTDLEVIDRAEDALSAAKMLIEAATSVSKERVSIGGGNGYRAMSLRSVWRAQIGDAKDSWALAYGHYKQQTEFMDEFKALIQKWADRDARIEANRVRSVPGFKFIEEKVV